MTREKTSKRWAAIHAWKKSIQTMGCHGKVCIKIPMTFHQAGKIVNLFLRLASAISINYFRCILCRVIKPTQNRVARKTSRIGHEICPFSSQHFFVCSCGSEINAYSIQILSMSTPLSGFNSLGLMNVPNME